MPESTNNLPLQQQEPPGYTDQMRPVPDHGETSYNGSGKLAGKVALITGSTIPVTGGRSMI